MSFSFSSPSLIESVNTYAQSYCSLVSWQSLRFYLFALRMRAYAESFPVTTDDASCFRCLLVQVPLISRRHSTRSAKLPLAVTVVVIVEFMCIQDYEERIEGVYAQHELNI